MTTARDRFVRIGAITTAMLCIVTARAPVPRPRIQRSSGMDPPSHPPKPRAMTTTVAERTQGPTAVPPVASARVRCDRGAVEGIVLDAAGRALPWVSIELCHADDPAQGAVEIGTTAGGTFGPVELACGPWIVRLARSAAPLFADVEPVQTTVLELRVESAADADG